MNNPQFPTSGNGYGGGYYPKNDVNDSINVDNFLWLATNGGVIKINQITRDFTKYTKENSGLPSNEVETIAVNQQSAKWIGTYGHRIAFMNEEEDKWVAIPYDLSLFEDDTVDDNGKILLGGDKDNWLRTNYIHFDKNSRKWSGPFNPIKDGQPFNVLFIRDIEGGIEISGNYKRGYEPPVDNLEIYRLSSVISADDSNWQMMTEVPVEEPVVEEIPAEE